MEMIEYDITGANWITHDNKLYRQDKGIPMGSPTSTKYAEIYTNYFITINWKRL